MLQRIQTLYLLAAVLLCGLSFVFPLASYSGGAPPEFQLRTTAVMNSTDGVELVDAPLKYPIYLVYGIVGVALLVDVFLYRNRKRQLTVLRSLYVLVALILVLQIVTQQATAAYLGTGRRLATAFGPVMFFPLGILFFMYLAQRGIRADEELVKSADRLR